MKGKEGKREGGNVVKWLGSMQETPQEGKTNRRTPESQLSLLPLKPNQSKKKKEKKNKQKEKKNLTPKKKKKKIKERKRGGEHVVICVINIIIWGTQTFCIPLTRVGR